MRSAAGSLVLVALAVCVGPLGARTARQDAGAGSVLEEFFPDGTPRLWCELRAPSGSPVRHGGYRRWHAGGALAVEGGYVDGLPSGPWKAWRADGSALIAGDFLEGRRSGKWELHHAGGQLAGVGGYLLGCRDRRWVYFDEAGVKLESESGLYRLAKENHAGRVRKHLGETLDGVRHGRWSTWWPNGAAQTLGGFRRGLRSGELRFFHLDGTPDPDFIGGVYLEGQRVAGAVAPREPFRLPEEDELLPAGPPAIDLAALPRPARAPGVQSSERSAMRAWVQRHREADDDDERRKAELLLVQYGRAVVPELLEALRALDLDDPGERAHGARLCAGVLRGIAHAGFAWSPLEGEAGLQARRLAVLRWFSWWELVREDEAYWQAVAAAGEGAGPPLLDLRRIDGEASAAASDAPPRPAAEALPELFAARRGAGANRRARGDADAALDWLVRHQSADGGWSSAGFAAQCGAADAEPCSGAGLVQHDVGVSALALLALMAQGNTRTSGAHGEAVARGLGYLLGAQDPATGIFGPRGVRELLYHQATATEALAEAALFADEPEVREALQRAVDVILAARNPKGAWRYELPPNGENDTSVTSWMVTALAAAERAGARVDPLAYDGARWWLVAMTDPQTGRIGYDVRGGSSARLAITQHFPLDLTETMTAAGLHAERAMGARGADAGRLRSARALLYARPPEWRSDGTSNDVYYWFHGAHALCDERESGAQAWRKALLKVLHDSQRQGAHAAGSWDPDGPWGFAGGRVYATALGALALQAEWRDAP